MHALADNYSWIVIPEMLKSFLCLSDIVSETCPPCQTFKTFCLTYKFINKFYNFHLQNNCKLGTFQTVSYKPHWSSVKYQIKSPIHIVDLND